MSGPSGRAVRSGWRDAAARGSRFLRHRIYAALYRDATGNPGRSMIVAGTARSGTTWLAEIIASQVPCRIMFEPFQPRKVQTYSQFEYFQYLRPEQDDAAMTAFCEEVFTGRIRHRWIDREVARLRPEYRLIKEIRANLLLAWIARRYAQVPMLLIIRHPCAVVQSRLQLGWATDSDLASFLAQADLMQDHLQEHVDLIHATRTDVGKHALIWCISNLVPLRQFSAGRLPVVFYENLCDQPEVEIPKIFDVIGHTFKASIFDSLAVPSSTSRGVNRTLGFRDRASSWRGALSTGQIDEVLGIVNAFGLGYLYGDSTSPLARVS